MSVKRIADVFPIARTHWVGDGFHVKPVFGEAAFTNTLSPFLMFDYGSPKYFPPTAKQLGVGQHPHRGFETVTIAFQGEIEHGKDIVHLNDSHKNKINDISILPVRGLCWQ